MGMLTADEKADLLDPASWKKSRFPVFQSDPEKGIFGPGHNSFTVSGDKTVMVYHARQYDEIIGNPLYDPNRHAMLMELEWIESGEPDFRLK